MAAAAFEDLIRQPVIVAPMPGGPSTTDLVLAAVQAVRLDSWPRECAQGADAGAHNWD